MTTIDSTVWFDNGEARVSDEILAQAFAGSYAKAAAAGNDMREVAELIEASRERVPVKNDPFACIQSLTHMAAYVDQDEMALILVDAVDQVRQHSCGAFIHYIQSRTEPEQQWSELLRVLGSALAVWDIGACLRLLQADVSIGPDNREMADWLLKWLPCVEQGRWELNGSVFERLMGFGFLSDRQRALCLCRLGLIVLLCENRYDESLRLLQEARTLVKASEPEIEISMAEYWLHMRKPHLATNIAETAVKRWPGFADLYSMLARASVSTGDKAQAESWYIQAQVRAVSSWPVIRDYANLLVNPTTEKRDEEAEKLAERSMLIEPEDAWQRAVEMATAYLEVERIQEARRWADRARELRPDVPMPHVMFGKCLTTENPDEAKAAFETAMQTDLLGAGDIAAAIGLHWELAEDRVEATRWYEIAASQVEKNPRMRPSYQAKLAEMRLNEETLQGLSELHELLAVGDDLGAAFFPLIDYAGKQPRDKATQELQLILEATNPILRHYVYNVIGNVEFRDQNYEEAAEAYKAAVTLDGNDPVLHRNLAGAYGELQHWELAEKELQLAFEEDGSEHDRDKELALLYNLRGNALYEERNYPESVEWYQRAATADPTDAIFHRNLAAALLEETRPGERIPAYSNAARAWNNAVRAGGDYSKDLADARDLVQYAKNYGEAILDWTPAVEALQLAISEELIEFVADGNNDLLEQVQTSINEFRAWFKNSFGLSVPGIRFVDDKSLDPGAYVGRLYGRALVKGQVELTERLYNGSAELLEQAGIVAKSETNPFDSKPAFWIADQDIAAVEAAGGEVWSVAEYPIYDLMRAMLGNLKMFVGYQEIVNLLAESTHPATERFTSIADRRILTRVVSGLVAEQVSISPFGEICEVVANGISGNVSITTMVELARAIPVVQNSLNGIEADTLLLSLDADSEGRFERSVVIDGTEPVLAGLPEDCKKLMATIRENLSGENNVAVMVESTELRPHVRRLYEYEFPRLPVLSRGEIENLQQHVQRKLDS